MWLRGWVWSGLVGSCLGYSGGATRVHSRVLVLGLLLGWLQNLQHEKEDKTMHDVAMAC